MLRRVFILTLGIMLLGGLAGCERSPASSPVAAGQTVLAFGDSVTYGTGAAQGEDWPTLLAEMSGWVVINAGVPRDTAEAGRLRIEDLLAEHQPRLVLIEIGGNDFLKRRPAAAVKEDIRQLIRVSRAAGAQVVLIAVPELSLTAMIGQPGDASLYADLGKEEAVPVIESVFSDVLGQPALRSDAVHPNAAGYRQMAEGIYHALRKQGLTR